MLIYLPKFTNLTYIYISAFEARKEIQERKKKNPTSPRINGTIFSQTELIQKFLRFLETDSLMDLLDPGFSLVRTKFKSTARIYRWPVERVLFLEYAP